jgi:hypothetical protein
MKKEQRSSCCYLDSWIRTSPILFGFGLRNKRNRTTGEANRLTGGRGDIILFWEGKIILIFFGRNQTMKPLRSLLLGIDIDIDILMIGSSTQKSSKLNSLDL